MDRAVRRPPRSSSGRVDLAAAAAAVIVILIGGACAPLPPPARPAPEGELDLAGAVEETAADLAQQLGRNRSLLVIDPLLDRTTGEQTGVSLRVETELAPRLEAAISGLTVLPFDAAGVERSPLVLTGTVQMTEPPDRYALSVAVTDRPSGLVIAQSAFRFREADLDGSPTAFYRDSPSLVRDRSVEGYIRTAETPAGRSADALYIEQIATSSMLAQALAAYQAQRWEEALDFYSAAAARPDGQQLRTFNGIYLSNLRLGRTAAAEQAFERIVRLGLATNNLAVKLLFRPGSSTDFWPGADLADVYPMWLRQIARAARESESCLNVVGHTSRSGTQEVNDRLSLARAETVSRLLRAAEPALRSNQLRASGVGYRDNIVGTGADDATDAVDRRVEFETIPCAQ